MQIFVNNLFTLIYCIFSHLNTFIYTYNIIFVADNKLIKIMKIIGTYPALRMRRNRKADWIRRVVSEHNLSASDLILPLFITTKKINFKCHKI